MMQDTEGEEDTRLERSFNALESNYDFIFFLSKEEMILDCLLSTEMVALINV